MDPARWQQVERIYHAAAERPNEERASFLDKECAGDTDLRAEVERMLTVEADVGVFLDAPAMEMAARAWAAAEPVPLGSRLGPYEIVGLLGAGAMGEVYRARDMRLDRTVAIKLLPTFGASGRERFLCEARIASALNHPNIVTLHDIVNEGGRDALVMEYLEGETLEEKIGGKGLPLRAVLHYAIQIADGLAAAHAAGVVHRDVKPGNIMVTGGESGPCTVKVLDFGLAQMRRSRGLEDQPGSGTARGTIAGTVAYMSPEQAEGQQVDARSDLFSFGCVLYEMLAGRQAFRGSSQFSTLSSILRDTPAPLNLFRADVPAELDRILGQCLAKDRGARYQSAGQLHQDLAGCLASVAAAESGVRSTLLRRRTMTAALLAVVLASWLWHRSSRERWALETAAPEITRLVDAGEYVKAAALTREARSVLPKDPTLEKLWMRATGEVSIASVPSGANVSIRPYRGDPNTWETLGRTPLQKVRVPLDTYVWRLVKPGFATAFFIDDPPGVLPPGFHSGFDWTWKLRPEGSVPPEMVVVTGARVGLAYPLAYAPSAQVDDFLIDRHEVTNEEYKKFVDAGGYQKREFWKQSFVKGGRTVTWEDAVALFHDATGRSGPATWEMGEFPKGQREISGRWRELVRGGGVRGVRGQEPSHGLPLGASVAIRGFYATDHFRK